MGEIEFKVWLRQEMESRNINSAERLGRMIGYSGTSVRKWLKGPLTPEERACDAIANAFGIDHNEVRRLADRPESPQSHFVSSSMRVSGEGAAATGGVVIGGRATLTTKSNMTARPVGAHPVDVVYLPVIGVAAADTLRTFWGPGDLYPVSRQQVHGVSDPVLFVVSGDCMEPRIFDGDLVVLDRAGEPSEGDVVAVRMGDDITLKEYWSEDDEVVLRAVKADYPPIRIKRSDQGASLVGVARAWFRSGKL